MNIDFRLHEDAVIWLESIKTLPLEANIRFTLPVISSEAEGRKFLKLVKFIIAGLSAGRNVQIDRNLQLPIVKSIVKRLPVGGELSFLAPYPQELAASFIAQLEYGRVLVLTETSASAAYVMVGALQSGRILRIPDMVSEPVAIAAVKALRQGCTLGFPEGMTVSLGKKLLAEMKPYQVLSLPSTMDIATTLSIVKFLPRGCALQLSAHISREAAQSIIALLPRGCILKIENTMSASLVATMLRHLPSGALVSLPAYTEENFNRVLNSIKQLKPDHILRISPAMDQNIAAIIVRELPPACTVELSSLMSDEAAIKTIKTLPKGCLLKLPEDLSFERMVAWIKALKPTCQLSVPADMGKFMHLAIETAGYRPRRATYAELMKELKTPEDKIELEVLEHDAKTMPQPIVARSLEMKRVEESQENLSGFNPTP